MFSCVAFWHYPKIKDRSQIDPKERYSTDSEQFKVGRRLSEATDAANLPRGPPHLQVIYKQRQEGKNG